MALWKTTDSSPRDHASPRIRALSIVIVTMFTVTLGAVLAEPASAHAGLRKSTPAKGAKVTTLSEATLEFTEQINPKVVKVQLRDTDGKRHESGAPKVDGATVTQQISGDLTPGTYTLVYRVVCADGHPVQGEIPFTVTGTSSAQPTPAQSTAAAANPAPTPAAAPAEESGTAGSRGWLVVGGGLLAVLAIATGVYLLHKRPLTATTQPTRDGLQINN